MKFRVEVGGFVTVFRKRNLVVFADSVEEAEAKAIDKFVEGQQAAGGDLDCGDVTVNDIIKEK